MITKYRFITIGRAATAVATLTDFCVAFALVERASLSPAAATAIGFVGGAAVNFGLSRIVTARSSGRLVPRLDRYALVSATGLLFNVAGVALVSSLPAAVFPVFPLSWWVVRGGMVLLWNLPLHADDVLRRLRRTLGGLAVGAEGTGGAVSEVATSGEPGSPGDAYRRSLARRADCRRHTNAGGAQQMITRGCRGFRVSNAHGMPLRLGDAPTGLAERFCSEISISNGRLHASGKSITSLLSLAVPDNAVASISASGDDARSAIHALAALAAGGYAPASQGGY